MKKGIVRNWMSSPVVTVSPDTRLVDARRIMDAEKIRALPVVKEDRLVGIVTRRGLLRSDMSTLDEKSWKTDIDLQEKINTLMTIHPLTILPTAAMPKAARIMLENKITALPVVDEKQELVGIVTNTDIFRTILEELPDLKEDIRVRDYMTREIVSVDPDASLLEAHRLMGTQRIRALIVLEGEKMVGLVTRTDLMNYDPSRFISRKNQEESLTVLTGPVEQIMTRTIITINADSSILEAAQTMLEKKIHCLPVVDNQQDLVGILTESDLFRLVVQKFF